MPKRSNERGAAASAAKRPRKAAGAEGKAKKQKKQKQKKQKQKQKKQPKRREGLEWLLAPVERAAFEAEHWERRPLLVRREAREYYGELFSFAELLRRADDEADGDEVRFGTHVNAFRYADGRRHPMNPDDEDDEGTPARATSKALRRVVKAGGSLQFHQPQRHSEALHRLMARLEGDFGCLVGANVYVTPPGSQGLPPHHDDIEAFVMQLEGEKEWELYEPVVELPTSYSADLDPAAIGKPVLEVTLRPGDLLYFPRGTVHQARVAPGAPGHSCHLTVSTYQRFSWSAFMAAALPRAVRAAAERPEFVQLRRGLPLGFLGDAGAWAGDAGRREAARARFREMLADPAVVDALADEMENAADHFSVDFVTNRLPPPGDKPRPPPHDVIAELDPSARVRLADRSMMRLVRTSADEVGADGQGELVTLFHALNNDRRNHMLSLGGGGGYSSESEEEDEEDEEGEEGEEDEDEDEDEDEEGPAVPDGAIVFPSAYYGPLFRLFQAYPKPVPVINLVEEPDSDEDDDEDDDDEGGERPLNVAEVMQMVMNLVAEGVLVLAK